MIQDELIPITQGYGLASLWDPFQTFVPFIHCKKSIVFPRYTNKAESRQELQVASFSMKVRAQQGGGNEGNIIWDFLQLKL